MSLLRKSLASIHGSKSLNGLRSHLNDYQIIPNYVICGMATEMAPVALKNLGPLAQTAERIGGDKAGSGLR